MLSPEDRASIESVLRHTVETTRQRLTEARYEVHRAVSKISSGIPAPDGGAQIQAATRSERHANRAYQVARKRLYDYLLDDKIPEDLNLGG